MLKVNLELCSGCKRCMLACSFFRKGGFNPRLSSIEIRTDMAHRPVAYAVRECSDCEGHYCLQFCSHGAIEVLS